MDTKNDITNLLNDKLMETHIEETKSMEIDIVDDNMIMANKISVVTSPVFFEKGQIPVENGLFSEFIFGTTPDQRSNTLAYIDLHGKFFHPYLYEILIRTNRKLDRVAKGESSWDIVDGDLVEIGEDSPNYSYENTGLQWLINNFNRLHLKEGSSYIRNERIQLIQSAIKTNSLFITKYIVIPISYRDIDRTAVRPKVPEINDLYANIIRYANSLQESNIGFIDNKVHYMLQQALILLRQMGQTLIEGKHGFFKKGFLGKNSDFGTRSVISLPVLDGIDKPEDSPVDISRTGIPLAQCLGLGFPFIHRWVMEFFKREFETTYGEKYPCYETDEKTDEKVLVYKDLDDPLQFYNQKYIKKQIDAYINTQSIRFEPIVIPLLDKEKEYYLSCKGRLKSSNSSSPYDSTISDRTFTWTDLFYIAAEECLFDKHVYITRYPIDHYFNIFPSKIRVLSTIKTFPVIVGDKLYKFYPVVRPEITDPAILDTLFIDTVTMCNSNLEIIGGDYDGDTVSVRMLFTQEANEEAHEILNSIKFYFDLQQNMVRNIHNEAVLTWYNLSIY